MKQRGKEDDSTVKGRRRSVAASKAPKAAASHSSVADLRAQVDALTRELTEAREQETATSEVLHAISISQGDLTQVFKTIGKQAETLCDAEISLISMVDGDLISLVSISGVTAQGVETVRQVYYPMRRSDETVAARAIRSGAVCHVPDVLSDPLYPSKEAARVAGFRACLAVPMVHDGQVIGAIFVARKQPGLFADAKVQLLKTFADQAIIAIENVRLFNEIEARNRSVTEALEHQMATSEVLGVISRSPTDAQPVFESIAQSGERLCEALVSLVYLYDGELLHVAATNKLNPEVRQKYMEQYPRRPDRSQSGGRAVLDGETAHIPDVWDDPDYSREIAAAGGWRAALAVPMLRDGRPIGSIAVAKAEPGPFPERQIRLLRTFADQAVIAIENTRLVNELREALEQQTATADVLKVISRSAFDLQAVLDTLVESAVRLCRADKGGIVRRIEGAMRYVSTSGYSPEMSKYLYENPPAEGRGSAVGRVVEKRRIVHIPDVLDDRNYEMKRLAEVGSFRTVLAVPLLRGDALIGVFAMTRAGEPQPFTDKEIELVQSFADQAVIAIENVRLFEEVQARTAEVTEALQQQTATAEVLKVISRSAFDLQTVLDTLTQSAAQLCEADMGAITRRDGDGFLYATNYQFPDDWLEFVRTIRLTPERGSVIGRSLIEGRTVHVADVLADPEYTYFEPQKKAGYRTFLGVPLLREGQPIGVFAMARKTVSPFSERQIELVSTFADQAVIAIENARLFEEVQARTAELSEALQQQTATADVLKVISRSTFDLQSVLDALAETATRVCEADKGAIMRRDGEVFDFAANAGFPQELVAYAKSHSLRAGRGSATSRAALEMMTIHLPDVLDDPEYTASEFQRLGGYRTMLAVPLLREGGAPIGVFILTRTEVKPFTEKQIELVETFADQAVIAIENVRLFDEVQHRTNELARSLADLRTTQDRLVQTEKLASLGQLTAGIAHEIKNPLNFVNNFSSLSAELIDELNESLQELDLTPEKRAEIGEVADLLRGNLQRVVQHGRRADSIVKNMLLHSRQGSGERRKADINAILEESLNLAYHGARAEKKSFNITMEKSLDPEAGQIDLFPQEITRVFLNLISNGFYAATKRKEKADGASYEPTLTASTRNLGDSVEIRIRDNGTGIPPEVREKLFSPFFTTKPAGEGTGLGLSLSHDIVVKQHAGSIEVESEPGAFTEFKIVLPRAAATRERGAEP